MTVITLEVTTATALRFLVSAIGVPFKNWKKSLKETRVWVILREDSRSGG